ncbi:hypothetical protein OROMI_006393 [Orobanche minor]
MREFDFHKRLQSFFCKAAELCMVGFTDGVAQGAVSNLASSNKEGSLGSTDIGLKSIVSISGLVPNESATAENEDEATSKNEGNAEDKGV